MTPRRAEARRALAAALAGAALWLAAAAPLGAETGDAPPRSAEQKGVHIDFDTTPVAPPAAGADGTLFQEFDVAFRIADAATRQPLTGRRPGAWIDAAVSPLGPQTRGCKEKIDGFLKSSTGARPIVDLTSYYILAFNRDASISVIDPLVGISGRTNLRATIALSGPPGDWTMSPDRKRLYVTIPSAGKVAVVDADSFRLLEEIDSGQQPLRLRLSADGGRLFVANDALDDDGGGVTVIETSTRRTNAHIATGSGHHEIALSESGALLFVSNREKGDVAVIDASAPRLVARLATGPTPIALAYSSRAQALYVADGADGFVTVIDGRAPRVIAHIDVRPGLGPMAVTPDQRFALVLNTKDNLLHVIEVATNRLVQQISVGARPYQLVFSDAFAYVVSLDSERVAIVSLRDLGKAAAEQISSFTTGAAPPSIAPDLGVGTTVARAIDDAAVMIANPVDNTIYYYMEGMLAPSGSFQNPGKEVRAIGVLDHGLVETAPGVYSARARLPAGGRYEAAVMIGAVFECFPLRAAPATKETHDRIGIDYVAAPASTTATQTVSWRFRLTGARKFLADAAVAVLCYAPAGAGRRLRTPAQQIEPGVFEARLSNLAPGAYYVYVAAPAWGVDFGDLPPRHLLVRPGE